MTGMDSKDLKDLKDPKGPKDLKDPRGTQDIEDKIPRALWVRLFVYVVVGHVFAAFIYFLFEMAPKK